jgi:hypothetical protein
MANKNGVIVDTSKLNNALEILDELSKLFDDRISDLYQVKGGMEARHAFMFYRDRVWGAMHLLQNVNIQEQ